ncbi:MAG: hypothetical protein EB084_03210 [Proteobacteria bacterium]|nr:hypothetical protein [Pseudomonadota bacterium]
MASDRDRVILAEAVSKCWQDADFKARFISNPAAELKAAGMDIAAGTTVQVFESTATVTYLALSHDLPLEQYALTLGKAIAAKLPLKPGSEVRLVSTTPSYLPICLPTPPGATSMTDADLLAVAGGDYTATAANVVQTVNAATTANAAAVANVAGATNAVGAAEAVVVAAVII